MRPWWLNFTLANTTARTIAAGVKPALGMLLGTVLLLFQAAFPFFGAEARSSAAAALESRVATLGSSTAATNDGPDIGEKVIMIVVDALSVADFTADSGHAPQAS